MNMIGGGGRLNRSGWTQLGFNIIILELSELRSLLLLQDFEPLRNRHIDRQIDLLQTQTLQRIDVNWQIDRKIYYKHGHYKG